MFASKSPTMDCVESTSRCSDGPILLLPSCFVEQRCDLLLGQDGRPRLAASRAGPISLGTVPLVIVCPGREELARAAGGTQDPDTAQPIADTECTLADASTGILYRLSMLSVALTPCAVGLNLGDPTDLDSPDMSRWMCDTDRPTPAARRPVGIDRHRAGSGSEGSTSPVRPVRLMSRRRTHKLIANEAGQHRLLASLHRRVGRVGRCTGCPESSSTGPRPQDCSRARKAPEKTGAGEDRVVDGAQRQSRAPEMLM